MEVETWGSATSVPSKRVRGVECSSGGSPTGNSNFLRLFISCTNQSPAAQRRSPSGSIPSPTPVALATDLHPDSNCWRPLTTRIRETVTVASCGPEDDSLLAWLLRARPGPRLLALWPPFAATTAMLEATVLQPPTLRLRPIQNRA